MTVICPVDESRSKLAASAPDRLYVSVSFSVSVPVTGKPTFVPAGEFSSTLRVVVATRARELTFLSCVFAVLVADHALSPSWLIAFTCTS